MEEDSGSNSLPDHAIDPSSSRILQSKSNHAEDDEMEEEVVSSYKQFTLKIG